MSLATHILAREIETKIKHVLIARDFHFSLKTVREKTLGFSIFFGFKKSLRFLLQEIVHTCGLSNSDSVVIQYLSNSCEEKEVILPSNIRENRHVCNGL